MSSRRASMSSRFRRQSTRAPSFDLQALEDPETFAWKRKYRQSLNDVDLATRLAAYMPPELRTSFLEHNRNEFETVLESQPRRSTMCSSISPHTSLDEERTWRDYELNTLPPVPQVPAHFTKPDDLSPTASREPQGKRQKLLRPMKSFINFVRRPSLR